MMWSRDFSFHFMEQETRGAYYGCRCRYKAVNNGFAYERQQLKRVRKCEMFNLSQMNRMPARDSNTLDLLFTNDMALFSGMKVNKISISDHKIMEVTTT